jgi:hypothetical protein
LTYEFDDLPILVKTLQEITSVGSTVFIAYGKERAATPTFLELVGQHFEVTVAKNEDLNSSDIEFPSFDIGIAVLKRRL